MPIVPLLHTSAALRGAMRRGCRTRGLRVVACRSADHAARLLATALVDAVVVGARRTGPAAAAELVGRYPGIPIFVSGPFRPDDGPTMLSYRRAGVRDVLVDGVDDHVAAEIVTARGASGARRAALADAPRLLRLTEPLQLRAWSEVLARSGVATTTAQLAGALHVTREHLSREFAAGGAPNIKRVIDLSRVICAADLLRSPGYSVATVARVLRFSSPSHLAGCAQRIAGATPKALPRLGVRGVLGRFLRGRTRSRL